MSRELNKIFDVQSRKARRDILDKFDLSADDKNKVLNKIGNGSSGGDNKDGVMEIIVSFEGYTQEGPYSLDFCTNGQVDYDSNEIIPYNSKFDVFERLGNGEGIIPNIVTMTQKENIYSEIWLNLFITTKNIDIDTVELIAIDAKFINNRLEIFLNSTIHNKIYSIIDTGIIKLNGELIDGNEQGLSNDYCVVLIASKKITKDNKLTAQDIREAINNNIILHAFAFQSNNPT